MPLSASTSVTAASTISAARVLVFNVDDGLFAVHLDWVVAAYPRSALPIHAIRLTGQRPRPFILHHDEPALIVDLREAFGLEPTLGRTTRSDLLVLRSGSLLLAVPNDACI